MKQRAFFLIILTGILWGTSALFVHLLAPFGFSSLQMTLMRALVSSVFLFLYILFKDKNLLKTNAKELIIFACSGISFFATASFYFAAMQMTSVSTAVVLMYTAPIFVVIYSVMFLGEKLTPLKTASIAIMIIGCGLVSGIIGGLKFNTLGIILGFMSGISYAAYNIFTKISMQRGNNPFTATLYCFIFSAFAALISCKPQLLPQLFADAPPYLWIIAVSLGIFTSFLPYMLYTIALKSLPAGTASALGIIEPMSATLFSFVFLSEVLDIFSICGIVLILCSVTALSKSEK